VVLDQESEPPLVAAFFHDPLDGSRYGARNPFPRDVGVGQRNLVVGECTHIKVVVIAAAPGLVAGYRAYVGNHDLHGSKGSCDLVAIAALGAVGIEGLIEGHDVLVSRDRPKAALPVVDICVPRDLAAALGSKSRALSQRTLKKAQNTGDNKSPRQQSCWSIHPFCFLSRKQKPGKVK